MLRTCPARRWLFHSAARVNVSLSLSLSLLASTVGGPPSLWLGTGARALSTHGLSQTLSLPLSLSHAPKHRCKACLRAFEVVKLCAQGPASHGSCNNLFSATFPCTVQVEAGVPCRLWSASRIQTGTPTSHASVGSFLKAHSAGSKATAAFICFQSQAGFVQRVETATREPCHHSGEMRSGNIWDCRGGSENSR